MLFMTLHCKTLPLFPRMFGCAWLVHSRGWGGWEEIGKERLGGREVIRRHETGKNGIDKSLR